MQTDNIKPKISISEIAKTLGWSYTTVNSIINRKSPTDKLKIILECKDAKAYADAQDNLAKIASNAYADGIVTAEEQRAIADATAKMEAAKTHAQTLVNNVQVGGRNLLKNSKVSKIDGWVSTGNT